MGIKTPSTGRVLVVFASFVLASWLSPFARCGDDHQPTSGIEPSRDLALFDAAGMGHVLNNSSGRSAVLDGDGAFEDTVAPWSRFLPSLSLDEGPILDNDKSPGGTEDLSTFTVVFDHEASIGEAQIETQGSLSEETGTVEWEAEMSPNDAAFLWSQVDVSNNTNFDSLTISGDLNGQGFVRAGRYEPGELKALGRVDGVQGEVLLGSVFSTGVFAGASADSESQESDSSADQSLAVAYFSARVGDPDSWSYAGTLGLLGSTYEGETDRVAVLVQQEAALSKYLKLSARSEVDLNMHSLEGEDDFTLSGVNVEAETPLTSFLTLTIGFDHEKSRPSAAAAKNPDTAAAVDPDFQDGVWRHWVGATQKLPWNLEISGELAFEDSAEDDGYEDSWEVTLSKIGLFLLPEAKLDTTIFTEREGDEQGYSGTVTGRIPFLDERLTARPGVTFTVLEPGESAVNVHATELSFRVHWQVDKQLGAFAGTTHDFVEQPLQDSAVAEIGVQYYW